MTTDAVLGAESCLSRLRKWKLGFSLLALSLTTASMAQQANEVSLQEIVVTASKRQQNLQDVPIAVSAVTGAELQAMGADNFTDYARTIPGLSFTDLGAGRQIPAIRGINPTTGSDVVSYYIGETPLPSVSGDLALTSANPALVDIDRIEVLRGPQGTLYGSGSMGGTIKLVPQVPDLLRFSGYVDATGSVTQGAGGESPGGSVNLVLNAPIIDGIAGVRVAAWGRNIGGFVDRQYGYTGTFAGGSSNPTGSVKNVPDEHTWGFRTIGLVQPDEQFSVQVLVLIQDQKFDGFQDITGGASNPNNSLVQDLISDVPEPSENKFELYNITATYDFSRLKLVSATSYYHASVYASEEGTSSIQTFLGGAAFPNALEEQNALGDFTQEVRVATSTPIDDFDGVLGIYYSDKRTQLAAEYSPSQYNSIVAPGGPTDPLYAPGNNLFTRQQYGSEHELAQFGELTYHVTHLLDATFGLRHFSTSNDDSGFASGLFEGSFTPVPVIQSASSEGTIYKGNLSYHVTPDDLVFLQFSQGFRPGFGQTPPPASCNAGSGAAEVQPDSVDNYEVGAKTRWLDRRLTVNASVYQINWKNIQQLEFLPCGFDIVGNAGQARNRGVELEADGQITRHFNAGASFGYIRAELLNNAPVFGAVTGDQIENVPNWQYSIFGETSFPIRERTDGYARLDYQYTGSSFGNYNQVDGARDPAAELGALRLLNLRSGLRQGSWDFAVFGQNLLNQVARESVETSLLADIPGRPRYVVNRPRTFGVNMHYSF